MLGTMRDLHFCAFAKFVCSFPQDTKVKRYSLVAFCSRVVDQPLLEFIKASMSLNTFKKRLFSYFNVKLRTITVIRSRYFPLVH